MSFTWPVMLWLLLSVPLLVVASLVQSRRRRRVAVRFSSVALIRAALPRRLSWRRHVPPALLLLGIAGLGVASARPRTSVTVPIGRTSIILALDVSRSMCSTDVVPNRLVVAQNAARSFIKAQPSGTRIGIVAFAGFAELVVPPSTDKRVLIAAVDGLSTSRGTVIGSATLKALDAIAAVNPDVAPVDRTEDGGPAKAVPRRSGYVPDIIVLLTDGANTRGVEPLVAAEQAVARRVRVFTIGFGTTNPSSLVCTPEQLGGDALNDGGFGGGGPGAAGLGAGFPGGGAGGGRNFLLIDEPTLRSVAEKTGGKFYRAKDAAQLRGVFAGLPKQIELQRRNVEISAVFVGFGAVLVVAAIALSLRCNRSP